MKLPNNKKTSIPTFTPDKLRQLGYVEITPGNWQKPGFLPPVPGEPERIDIPAKGVRLRQSSKPLMNKLETRFYNYLATRYPNYPEMRIQAKRYKLGNGIWYKPDFTASSWPYEGQPSCETAWEVKGPHAFRGGFENLKVAAGLWPEVRFILVWEESGAWKEQLILP